PVAALLGGQEGGADAAAAPGPLPPVPLLAAQAMRQPRDVELEIEAARLPRQVGLEPLDALQQGRVARVGAQVQAAQEADRRHDVGLAIAWQVAVTAHLPRLDRVEEGLDFPEGYGGHGQAGESGTLEGRRVEAGHGQVAGRARGVAPAAAGGVL